MNAKLEELAALWNAQARLVATITALQADAARVLGTMDDLNAGEYTIQEICDCALYILTNS